MLTPTYSAVSRLQVRSGDAGYRRCRYALRAVPTVGSAAGTAVGRRYAQRAYAPALRVGVNRERDDERRAPDHDDRHDDLIAQGRVAFRGRRERMGQVNRTNPSVERRASPTTKGCRAY